MVNKKSQEWVSGRQRWQQILVSSSFTFLDANSVFETEWVFTDQQYKEVGFSGGTLAKNASQRMRRKRRGSNLSWEDPLEKEIATHSMDRGAWQGTIHGLEKELDTT